MVRVWLLLIALICPWPASAQDLLLEVVPDPRPTPPILHEMVLITIRGHYGTNIAIEQMDTPVLDGFGWTQLGLDRWYDVQENGRTVRIFERRMAIFPDRAGDLQIAPFVHDLTLVDPTGRRTKQAVTSAPVPLRVDPPLPDPGWWLPARALTATDEWQGSPERLTYGQTATRKVVIEVQGVGLDRLPPMPNLRSPGVFAFPLPEERTMVLTPDGPVARAVWRWSVLPDSPRPAVMPAVSIPWFDTQARQMRALVLDPQAVSIDGAMLGDDPHDGRLDAWGARVGPIGVVLGLLGGLGFGLARLRWRTWRWGGFDRLARWQADRQLRRAAQAGDAVAALRAARRLARHHPAAAPALGPLTARVFGPPDRPGPPLPRLVADLRRAARARPRPDRP